MYTGLSCSTSHLLGQEMFFEYLLLARCSAGSWTHEVDTREVSIAMGDGKGMEMLCTNPDATENSGG